MAKTEASIDSTLVENLKTAKANLKIAQDGLLAAESAIYLAAETALGKLPEKGTVHCSGVKMSLGFYEGWEQSKLAELEKEWPTKSNLPFPFKIELKADGKQISYLRENAKDAYALLAQALTLKPKKPSFVLADEKEEE